MSPPAGVKLVALGLVFVGVLLAGQAGFIHAKAALAQVLLERAFAESVQTRERARPWPWADTAPVARIAFPGLNRSAIVLAGDSGQALAFGPGQVSGTPAPGELGMSVFAAHRDTHFRFLGRIRRGDVVVVTRADGETVRFRVTGARVIRHDAFAVPRDPTRSELALVTCWPLNGTLRSPMRYVVFAERTD